MQRFFKVFWKRNQRVNWKLRSQSQKTEDVILVEALYDIINPI